MPYRENMPVVAKDEYLNNQFSPEEIMSMRNIKTEINRVAIEEATKYILSDMNLYERWLYKRIINKIQKKLIENLDKRPDGRMFLTIEGNLRVMFNVGIFYAKSGWNVFVESKRLNLESLHESALDMASDNGNFISYSHSKYRSFRLEHEKYV